MTPFSKRIQADGSVRWWQADPGRYVDAHQYQLVDWLAAGGVSDVVPYVPPAAEVPPVLQISKLRLRRALRSAGLEAAFDAALAGNAEWAADWADATELSSDDPMLLAALPALAAAAGMTVEQAQALLESAAVGV